MVMRKRKVRGEVYQKMRAPEFKELPPTGGLRRGQELTFCSVGVEVGAYHTFRKEAQRYTGTLVKGISTMHKSNSTPVIDQEQATDISRMRR
jgi:hypothetical protein